MKLDSKSPTEKYRQRIQTKRILSKQFDNDYRRKKALSQAKWRRRKREEQHMSTSTTVPINECDLRKKEGQRRRRANISKLKNENVELRNTVRTLTNKIAKLRSSRSPASPQQSSSKIFFDNVSPNAKQRTVLRIKDKKEDLPRGTSEQLRQKFGINISKKILPKKTSQSSLRTEIEAFLCRDDISKPCPDKHKQINNQQIRYRLNHLNILHKQFELETDIDIDYATFTRYVPSYIQKPNHDSWGTCLCMKCLNPQIKYEKLNQLKHKHSSIKHFMDSTPVDLYDLAKDGTKIDQFKENLIKLDKENILVTFCEWQKKKQLFVQLQFLQKLRCLCQ